MTPREKEIINLLKKNPGISQQEIADELKITRSGVSTHINNLMTSGYILGRGYILREDSYVAVLGGCNMDITGYSFDNLRGLSLIHISEPTRQCCTSRMPSSA